jgi:hypothetical protein
VKKGVHKYLLYVSLAFLVLALYRNDYLKKPDIVSPLELAYSLVLLMAGFLGDALAQQKLLNRAEFPITIGRSVSMAGLNIFAKYIPGKVMVIMGKALYLSEKCGYPAVPLSVYVFQGQILAVWCGLILSIAALFFIKSLHLLGWMGLAGLGIATILIFSPTAHIYTQRIFQKILGKPFHLPAISLKSLLLLLPWFMSPWILWGLGFYEFSIALTGQIPELSVILSFPLAATLGVLSLFAPGGIGVREGVLVYCLTLTHMDAVSAATLSVSSRLWFFIGEIFIFVLGYGLDRFGKK